MGVEPLFAKSVEDFSLDEIIIDDPDRDTIAIARALTPNMSALERGDVIDIDLDNPEGAAQFLEQVARLIRRRGKLRISVE